MKLPYVVGITHDLDGTNRARLPRSTKIAIGKPKGKAVHVYIATNTERTGHLWVLETGAGQKITRRTYPMDKDGRKLCERDYLKARSDDGTADRGYPEKLSYFTFLKDSGDGDLQHDFDCIEKHGPRPREIEIILTDDSPFFAEYALWSKSELRCHGNGVDAKRSVNFTPTKEDEALAAKAKEAGERFFRVDSKCFVMGCPFALPLMKNGKEYRQCAPYGSLATQLINDIRLGAKAEYTTTGRRTIEQLSAALEELAAFTGGGDPDRGSVRGIPLILTVAEFQTKHNGQVGTAFAVRLELRANSITSLRKKLGEAAEGFGPAPSQLVQIAAPAPAAPIDESRQLPAPAEPVPAAAEGTPILNEIPAFMDAQFVDDPEDEGMEAGDAAESAQTFAERKAELLYEAEQAAAPGIDPTTGYAVAPPVTQPTLDGAAEPYVDPGEQNDAPGKRKMSFAFAKDKK